MPVKEKAKAAGVGVEVALPSDTLETSEGSATAVADDEIAVRAYSYWESRGREGGSADEDWYRAIEELAREHNT